MGSATGLEELPTGFCLAWAARAGQAAASDESGDTRYLSSGRDEEEDQEEENNIGKGWLFLRAVLQSSPSGAQWSSLQASVLI